MQASGARIAKRAKEMSEAKAQTAESVNGLWSQLKEEVRKDLAKAK